MTTTLSKLKKLPTDYRMVVYFRQIDEKYAKLGKSVKIDDRDKRHQARGVYLQRNRFILPGYTNTEVYLKDLFKDYKIIRAGEGEMFLMKPCLDMIYTPGVLESLLPYQDQDLELGFKKKFPTKQRFDVGTIMLEQLRTYLKLGNPIPVILETNLNKIVREIHPSVDISTFIHSPSCEEGFKLMGLERIEIHRRMAWTFTPRQLKIEAERVNEKRPPMRVVSSK